MASRQARQPSSLADLPIDVAMQFVEYIYCVCHHPEKIVRHFYLSIINGFMRADPKNTSKLAAIFPEYHAVFEAWKQDEEAFLHYFSR
jgi:hypothetical protein